MREEINYSELKSYNVFCLEKKNWILKSKLGTKQKRKRLRETKNGNPLQVSTRKLLCCKYTTHNNDCKVEIQPPSTLPDGGKLSRDKFNRGTSSLIPFLPFSNLMSRR